MTLLLVAGKRATRYEVSGKSLCENQPAFLVGGAFLGAPQVPFVATADLQEHDTLTMSSNETLFDNHFQRNTDHHTQALLIRRSATTMGNTLDSTLSRRNSRVYVTILDAPEQRIDMSVPLTPAQRESILQRCACNDAMWQTKVSADTEYYHKRIAAIARSH